MLHVSLRTGFVALLTTVALSGCAPGSSQAGWSIPESFSAERAAPTPVAQVPDRSLPALIVSDEPPPEVIYRRGSRDIDLGGSDADIGVTPRASSFDTAHIKTLVTDKANDLAHELDRLQRETNSSANQLRKLQVKNDAAAAEYYALVASISTDLQSGTTPGNPVLTDRWSVAQDKLNALSEDVSGLNALATDLANQASHATYLLEATQTAFSLSGAVQEDHDKLRIIEDGISTNITTLNRLLMEVNDEINRRTTYLRAERGNLQTLSLGISKGELYGQSLTNSLFRKATGNAETMFRGAPDTAAAAPGRPGTRRPLVIIRFDRPSVNYDQPLYTAISQALEKYPAARFDLVAVSNLEGNAAQLALASAEARKNGESVLRSLNQMGLPIERVRLSAANSKDVLNSEVHIYLQ